eukprot:scaffold19667_cov70-Phaeocystis_antarctica.AAC.6
MPLQSSVKAADTTAARVPAAKIKGPVSTVSKSVKRHARRERRPSWNMRVLKTISVAVRAAVATVGVTAVVATVVGRA